MNLRIKYGKNKRARFLSHLDLMRAWERTFRRAEIPIAFSQGFNPHPKISFGSALAVGVTSSGEYLDIELKNSVPIKEIISKLEKYLPVGLEVYDVVEIDKTVTSLMATINRAQYIIKSNLEEPIDQNQLEKMLESFLQQEHIMIVRQTKKGKKEKNIREGIINLTGEIIASNKVKFQCLVQTGSEGNVRPEEIIFALKETGVPLNTEALDIHREGLYVSTEKGLTTPLVT